MAVLFVAMLFFASFVLVLVLWMIRRAAHRAMAPTPRRRRAPDPPDPWEESARRAQTPTPDDLST